jgi:hypothetical protein
VDEAYNNFEKAFAAALEEAHSNYQAATPDNVKTLAYQVIEDISMIPY